MLNKLELNCKTDFQRAAVAYMLNPKGKTHLVFYDHGVELLRKLGDVKLVEKCKLLRNQLLNLEKPDIKMAEDVLMVGVLARSCYTDSNMARKRIPAVVWQEGKWFVARALDIEVASQGKTKKEALDNLQEAMELFLEDEKVPVPTSVIPPDAELKHIYA